MGFSEENVGVMAASRVGELSMTVGEGSGVSLGKGVRVGRGVEVGGNVSVGDGYSLGTGEPAVPVGFGWAIPVNCAEIVATDAARASDSLVGVS